MGEVRKGEAGEHLEQHASEMSEEARIERAVRAGRPIPEHHWQAAFETFRIRKQNPTSTIHVARLFFDSWTHLPTVMGVRDLRGLRSGESLVGLTRHQVFTTAWHDVDLWGECQSDGFWYLIAQIMPKAGGEAIQPLKATLVGTDKSVSVQPQDGEFHIGSVRSGTYDLRIQLDRAEVMVPNIQVGM